MSPGAEINTTVPATVAFVPYPPSDPDRYYFWLNNASRGLIARVAAEWTDAIGNQYGPAGQNSFVTISVPIVQTDLQQLQTSCTPFGCFSSHVPWRLDLTSGAQADLVFPWNASGSSTARDAHITAARPRDDSGHPVPPPRFKPGESGSATFHWSAPANPTLRQSGEAQDAYLTRLKTPITNTDARARFHLVGRPRERVRTDLGPGEQHRAAIRGTANPGLWSSRVSPARRCR